MTFQEALRARLQIIHPSLKQLTEFNESKNIAEILTPGVQYVIKAIAGIYILYIYIFSFSLFLGT